MLQFQGDKWDLLVSTAWNIQVMIVVRQEKAIIPPTDGEQMHGKIKFPDKAHRWSMWQSREPNLRFSCPAVAP